MSSPKATPTRRDEASLPTITPTRRVLDDRPKAASGPTVANILERYVANLADRGKPTDDARYRADAQILPRLGSREVATLVTEDYQRWLSDLAKSPSKRRTREGGTEALRSRQATANRVWTGRRAVRAARTSTIMWILYVP